MWMLLIPLTAAAIAQAGLGVVCFLRYPRTRFPAVLLVSLALSYALLAMIGGGWLVALHRAFGIDPMADWTVDLLIQHVVVTGALFAAACAANVWLAFSIPVSGNAKRRAAVVDADGPLPVS